MIHEHASLACLLLVKLACEQRPYKTPCFSSRAQEEGNPESRQAYTTV
jgi:hypothetical protein